MQFEFEGSVFELGHWKLVTPADALLLPDGRVIRIDRWSASGRTNTGDLQPKIERFTVINEGVAGLPKDRPLVLVRPVFIQGDLLSTSGMHAAGFKGADPVEVQAIVDAAKARQAKTEPCPGFEPSPKGCGPVCQICGQLEEDHRTKA